MTRAQVRKTLVDNLEKRLIGPEGGPMEIIKDLPTRKYTVGLLYPMGTCIDPERAIDGDMEDNSDAERGGPIQRSSLKDEILPSSMGMSFMVRSDLDSLDMHVQWARYAQVTGTTDFIRKEEEALIKIVLPLTESGKRTKIMDKGEESPLTLVIKDHGVMGKGRHISVFLVNESGTSIERGKKGYKNERARLCVFSPKINISTNGADILARPRVAAPRSDDDLASMELLYRERYEFATGHGCSVLWKGEVNDRCSHIESTFMPWFIGPRLDFTLTGINLPMDMMADPRKKEETVRALEEMINHYSKWIKKTFSESEKRKIVGFEKAFDKHKADAEASEQRMRGGLKFLTDDARAYEAFLFMNNAMFLKGVHQVESIELSKDQNAKMKVIQVARWAGKYTWRPFQMAFILMSLKGLLDPKDPDRKMLDLLWISTGGGKTEAYLGLSTLAMAYRRLKGGQGSELPGVSVLMRYTLRLLTIQQFQRAAALMCACEHIRLQDVNKWGETPFMVGLYIGEGTTPNHVVSFSEEGSSAQSALTYWLKEKSKPRESNPFQLVACPWCGKILDINSYSIKDGMLRTHCTRDGCEFSKHEVPAVTVDDDIYHRLPSMVIATVDKFAQMPFNPKVAMLFGRVAHHSPSKGFIHDLDLYWDRTRRTVPEDLRNINGGMIDAPDLIVQDELHLISGPLGSMVGIYETTVEKLCERTEGAIRYYPKLIASTATIRRAEQQVMKLFCPDRMTRFPCPGTGIDDSFFVKQIWGEGDGKLYLGLSPAGIGQKTIMKKTMTSILIDTQRMKDRGEPLDDYDGYWTVVEYFNSIKELGSARTTIDDDVANNVKVDSTRNIGIPCELTSRVPSKDLPDILDRLGRPSSDPNSVSVLVCSNMFSVGVDVQRLGIMMVNGQPKSTSEYIQATGRVGRESCGLIIALYNWARPRDQSHFERFFDYHNRIQYHVEAVSVTPFSNGARDRALHAQLVGMVRAIDGPKYVGREAASKFDVGTRSSPLIKELVKTIVDRFVRSGTKGQPNEVLKQLDNFMDNWVVDSEQLNFKRENGQMPPRRYLMRKINDDHEFDLGPRVLTPDSMRNVEKSVQLHTITLNGRP